ncbi:nascent polypeptide-associated complex subunit alpha, muscle-specific form-like isoform X3 [Daphnia pulex]|uniref:nascent polypeptide-associated complex subunit alpha, muscle-specific form-like isoform X2 n=1 Tax=Daphnia pulex TaxID=6669 RepID=UPI001EE0992B|nr:nascent polypeptide-associated complex subunit alpha, muscle-specific form-like isoform X2 [Daphnia pulex]XP_046438235.1 nascent polypeptide-associated complex subunit alpha, muscle-specific form-like isoform X3 [Daphnia pulex]
MSSQRLKSPRIRTFVQESENNRHGSESPEARSNKNHIQKNKIALKDLTNKNLVNTPLKNMGNASDKDTEYEKEQAITKPQVGRQTRSKGKVDVTLNSTENQTKCRTKNSSKKANISGVDEVEETVNVGENLSNARKLPQPSRKLAKESANSCQRSSESSKTHSLKETLQTLEEEPSDHEEEDIVLKPKKSSAAKETSQTSLPKEILQPIQEELSDIEKEDNLPKPKNSSNKVPSTLSLDSETEIFESPRSTRRLRSMDTSQNTENEPLHNLRSPKPTAKNNANSKETPVCQTRSQVTESPVLRSTRKNKAAPASATKSKPKRKTVLERWLEEAGDTILPGGSSRTCRQSSRLQSTQSNVSSSSSMLSFKSPKHGTKSPSSKLMSPKSGSKFKSPKSASKTLATKKVPVWKTEPKPEAFKSAPDDVYGFECDPSDCKPVKKKRTRKPKNDDNDIFKSSRVKAAASKPTKRLQRTAVPLAEKPKTPIKSKPIEKPKTPVRSKPTEKNLPMNTTNLLKSVAEKLNNLVQPAQTPELEDVVSILNFSPIANHSSTVYDTTLPEEMDFDQHQPCLDEKSTSGVLAGDFEGEQTSDMTRDSQVEMEMEKLFGFEQEPENEPTTKVIESKLVKSTPIRQETVADCFSSVSPVRKLSKAIRKSINRPARIDENVARDLIRGIRPLEPVKPKSTKLVQYIQVVGENHVNEENAVPKKVVVPPTPPTVFDEPARKSYSKRDLRIAKRKILLETEDFDDFGDVDETPKKLKKRTGQKKNKRDKEEEQWCKVMNSHFEDIEKFNLSS